jgi:hypothetical protein
LIARPDPDLRTVLGKRWGAISLRHSTFLRA